MTPEQQAAGREPRSPIMAIHFYGNPAHAWALSRRACNDNRAFLA